MSTVFETASLKKALATVLPAVARNTTLPILTHIRVRFANIEASDLCVQITAPVHATGKPIDICIPAGRLKAAVAVAGDTIELDAKGGSCIIKSGKHRFKVPYLSGDDFPSIEERPEDAKFTTTSDMHAAMASVTFACAVNDIRYYLNGVFLECRDGVIEATATNGHFAATAVVGNSKKAFSTIIRKPEYEILTKASPGQWSVSSNMVILESDDARIVVTSLSDKFPDWRRIMNGGKNAITLNRAELIEAVSLSKIMRDEKKLRPMHIRVDGAVLKISTSMHGEAIDTEMDIADLRGVDLDRGLDGDLLEPILKAHSDETVTFTYGDDAMGSIMAENGGFRAVLMPLRL